MWEGFDWEAFFQALLLFVGGLFGVRGIRKGINKETPEESKPAVTGEVSAVLTDSNSFKMLAAANEAQTVAITRLAIATEKVNEQVGTACKLAERWFELRKAEQEREKDDRIKELEDLLRRTTGMRIDQRNKE